MGFHILLFEKSDYVTNLHFKWLCISTVFFPSHSVKLGTLKCLSIGTLDTTSFFHLSQMEIDGY